MKIGQAIDYMIEDRTREYECDGYKLVRTDPSCRRIYAVRKSDGLRIDEVLNDDLMSKDWDLVRPAVSFMEASNSGNMFKVKHRLIAAFDQRCSHNLSSFVLLLNKSYFDANSVREILRDGEFFIIEENKCDTY